MSEASNPLKSRAAEPAPAAAPAPQPKTPPAPKPAKVEAALCRPSERAGPGQKRFRVRADAGSPGVKYVLAASRQDAEAAYRKLTGAESVRQLVVTELPD